MAPPRKKNIEGLLTIKKIDATIRKLQKQRTALEIKSRRPIIASIVKTMRQHDIAIGEIQAALGKRQGRAVAKKAAVAPKYENKKTGETWSGRGRAAAWLVEAEAAGRKHDSFLIK